jgi:hypothetical protein
MTQRSLHTVTNVYYRSMSCFAMISRINDPACSAKVSRTNVPSCTMWDRRFTMYVTKYDVILHSTEQDTLPIVFQISKQDSPYQTRGGTCCPGVYTPKIRSLADLSTTCHDGINHLHHSNHCSNHIINPHMITSHLDGWKTTMLSQRHKPTVTPGFKAKTRCSSYVCPGSSCHTYGQNVNTEN